MKYHYRSVYIDTAEGLATAERLKRNGWKIVSSGLFSVIFEKKA